MYRVLSKMQKQSLQMQSPKFVRYFDSSYFSRLSKPSVKSSFAQILAHMFVRMSALTWAALASLAFHTVLLSIHFEVPQRLDRLIRNDELPFIVVNTHFQALTNKRAQALAQTNLTGGGEANSGRLRSPLPSANKSVDAPNSEDLEREEASLKSLEAQQAKLLAQVRAQLSSLSPAQPQPLNPDQESKRQRLLKMLAEIEERIEQSNKRPHKQYFSPSTRQSEFAVYYEQMRQKIETFGTAHFPTYQGRKLYGSLIMTVTINSSGQVLSVQINESSGLAELDRRAKAIVMSSGPFPEFVPSLKSLADQLALVSRYSFKENGTLDTEMR